MIPSRPIYTYISDRATLDSPSSLIEPNDSPVYSLLAPMTDDRNYLFIELPEKSIMLPPFVDSNHCLSYHLTRKGRSVADRVVSVLGYACPDITYSPSLYPITALLLHFMPGECTNK